MWDIFTMRCEPNNIDTELRVVDGTLVLSGRPLESIAGETPIYIYSMAVVKKNVETLREICSEADVEPYYAVKALSHPAILDRLVGLGMGLETVSLGEVEKALATGIDPGRIIYNGIGKNRWVIQNLLDMGIGIVNLDSEYEFREAVELGSVDWSRIGVRLNMDISKEVLDTASRTSKFGVEPPILYRLIEKHGVREIGIHIHLGSQISERNLLRRYMEAIERVLKGLEQRRVRLSFLDIGGGLPKNYLWSPVTLPHTELDTRLFSPEICMHAYRGFLMRIRRLVGEIPIYIEPGRYVVGDAGLLATRVIGMKERLDGTRWLILDAGFTHLLSGALYKWYFPLVNASRIGEPHDTPFRVAGPLCDSDDVFHDYEGEKVGRPRLPRYRYLPGETSVGDLLVFLHVGAYNYEEASEYNSIPRPRVVFV